MVLVTLDDADPLSEALLKLAREDGAERPNVPLVARRFGVPVLRAPPSSSRLWRDRAETIPVGDELRIYLRADVSPEQKSQIIGHELGHVAIRRWGLRVDGDEERWCQRFASALLLPRATVTCGWRATGGDLALLLARWADVPPTAVLLRVPEALGLATWIVQGSRARYTYGPAPTRAVFNAANDARRAGTARVDGLRAVRLADGRHRAGVIAA